jgi:Predicted signal transduction protein
LLLAGLLQDIGGLFLMQSQPELYQSLSTQAAGDNQRLLALENTHFGTDHAAIGAELARQWNLPAYLVDAIAGSETPPTPATDTFLRCVHASGSLADIWLDGPGAQPAQQRLAAASGLDQEALTEVFARVAQLLPDAASVFETRCPRPSMLPPCCNRPGKSMSCASCARASWPRRHCSNVPRPWKGRRWN